MGSRSPWRPATLWLGRSAPLCPPPSPGRCARMLLSLLLSPWPLFTLPLLWLLLLLLLLLPLLELLEWQAMELELLVMLVTLESRLWSPKNFNFFLPLLRDT